MERMHAYKASDGSLHRNSREWIEHEFYLILCTCTLNADKEMAAEVVDKFGEFKVLHADFETDIRYGEGARNGLVLDRRTLVKDAGPKVDTTVIPPDQARAEGVGVTHSPDPEWRNKSRDHPSEAPLDQPVGVGTGMKLGGALDDVAF